MLPESTHCLGEGSQLAAAKGCGYRADICAHDEKRKQLYGIHWKGVDSPEPCPRQYVVRVPTGTLPQTRYPAIEFSV
jgi:hypothetical protein